MKQESDKVVDRHIERYLFDAFERIDEDRGLSTPREIGEYLERAWGVGEIWREWWEDSGERYY